MFLTGCPPEPVEEPYVSSTYKKCNRTIPSYRDDFKSGFELKLGIGFDDGSVEEKIFRTAAEKWAEETGIELRVTTGHGMGGNIHIYDRLDVCSDGASRDDIPSEERALGCWLPTFDRIAMSRPGIEKFGKDLAHDAGESAPPSEKMFQRALYFYSLHEIGHWLGLGHAPHGEGSIMVPAPLQAFIGEGRYNRLWTVDKRLACLKNDCGENWCSAIKN